MRSRQEIKERCCSKLWLNITEYKVDFLLVNTADPGLERSTPFVDPGERAFVTFYLSIGPHWSARGPVNLYLPVDSLGAVCAPAGYGPR
jgi:hypothetical protein